MRKIVFLLLIFSSTVFGMEIVKVKNNIYMTRGNDGLPSLENRGFISNCYGVLTENGWFVIDSLSTPELSSEFLKNLKKIKNVPVKYLVITHYHQDHWYGAQTYKKENAVIIGHKTLKEIYENGTAEMMLEAANKMSKGLYKDVKLVPPDISISKEKIIKFGGKEFRIFPLTPAHTNSDIVVYIPDEKVIFVGDLVFYNRIPFAGDRNSDTRNWIKVLNKLKKMNIETVLAGHNKPLNKNSVDFTINYLSFLRERISEMKDKDLPYDEIKKKLTDTPYKKYPMYNIFHFKNIYKIYNDLDMEF
jgi:glyoxylase-like metal-dependent hydrolase (beta-lactamase superfamily II)